MRCVRLMNLLPLCALLAGCDIPVDFWQDASVNVDVPAVPQKSFTAGSDLNLASAAAQAQEVPGFQGIQIPDVELQISQVASSNAATTLSGSLVITDPSDPSFAAVTLPYANIPITDGGQTTVTPDPSAVQAIQQAALAGHTLHVDYNTTVDTTPAQFELTAHIHIVALVGT